MLDAFLSPLGFFGLFSIFLVGALGSLVAYARNGVANWWGNLFALLGSFLGIIFSLGVLLTGKVPSFSVPSSLPLLSTTFTVDYLSAFFMLVISFIACVCSLYAIGYVKQYYQAYNIGVLGFFYNIFVASMLLVVTTHSLLFFLIAWEMMSLASYFLVVYEHREEHNIRAGSLYFIMTHIGTAFIIFAFLLLYTATGSLEFDAIKNNAAHISPLIKNLIFIAVLIGFGTKAGIIPFHIWLPSAHPAAPSHVSALMSSVMIKTGIYMCVRLFVDVLPSTSPWWGVVILIAGSISSLLGVLYALSEHDLKRLLAYHSIENIGIILLGLGSALVFMSVHLPALAVLGIVAALFHTMNHATFKALLFLGAGSVISAVHTRNIEEYGGLMKYMPYTAFYFLIGSLAISALPPFNGFFSEWITFQSLFAGVASFGPVIKIIFISAIGSLAFTSGLAAACFVKAFGALFLARPRSEEVGRAHESALPLTSAMALLAILTLFLGFFAGPVSRILTRVAESLGVGQGSESVLISHVSYVTVLDGFAVLSMPAVLILLLCVVGAVAVIGGVWTRNRKTVLGRTWDCGTDLTPRMEITATGFSRSIITVFRGILRPTQQREIEYYDASLRYFPKARTITLELHDIYRSYFYTPSHMAMLKVSEQVKKIQNGNINAYILYIFLTLSALLLILVV